MNAENLCSFFNLLKYGEDSYHELMKNRVREILLLSSIYDAFILEQDGGLSEQIYGEYKQLNLSTAPRITNASMPDEALKLLDNKKFDLIITLLNVGDITTLEFAKQIKTKFQNLPILLLLKSNAEVEEIQPYLNQLYKYIDDIFLWNGDAKIFLAMVKSIEDKKNIENDTRIGLVRVILLVEDSVQYYSIFLPLLYTEVMKQTQLLIEEELSDIQKRLRMRVRPKIILLHTYEDAIYYYNKYKEYILSVISDIRFPNHNQMDNEAGLKLVSMVRQDKKNDIPCILMSSDQSHEEKAKELGVTLINKFSQNLLHEIRNFMLESLGFGDFKFQVPGKGIVTVAKTIYEFEEKLKEVPDESVLYHSNRNHFSTWLLARGEIQIAKKLRPLKPEDFNSIAELKSHLINSIRTIRERKNKGKIIHFDPNSLTDPFKIILLSEGSLGGKGRGIAFMNNIIVSMNLENRYANLPILQPCTSIIGTNEYDKFIDENNIDITEIISLSDREINETFINYKLSDELREKLSIYIDQIKTPLAVRSSGLLEDSTYESFAGIYRTYMIPNNHPDKLVRLKQLESAIKLVYASVFLKSARGYIESINHKIEEEKMAVILQKIVGDEYEPGYFYPAISGIASSHNYYPVSPLTYSDSIALIAIGLGKAVVTDGIGYRFSPKYPKVNLFDIDTLLRKTPTYYYAIDLNNNKFDLISNEDCTMRKLCLDKLNNKLILKHCASIYDHENNKIIPYREDKPKYSVMFSFDNILKYNRVPFSEIIENILEIGKMAFGGPVEIEFALKLSKEISKFYILQIRPSISRTQIVDIDLKNIKKEDIWLMTNNSLGNGIIDDIHDIIYVKPEKFDNTRTLEIQKEVEVLNEEIKKENKKYILIGPGRWGTADRFLGIPVKFYQICNANVITEVILNDFNVELSQGTHFLHNLISMNIGYLVINNNSNSFIDWKWLKQLPVVKETNFLVHSRAKNPQKILMDGRKGIAIIYKK